MPRDAVSRTANVERNGGHKWVNVQSQKTTAIRRKTVEETVVSRHHKFLIEDLLKPLIQSQHSRIAGIYRGPLIGPDYAQRRLSFG